MARLKEDLITRIARHVDVPDLRLLLKQDCSDCLIWNGALLKPARGRPKPHLHKIGNPVRVLFAEVHGTLDYLTILRNMCGTIRCINPHHYVAKSTFSTYENRSGSVPSLKPKVDEFDEDNVIGILELLQDGEPPEDIFASPNDLAEAMRRHAL